MVFADNEMNKNLQSSPSWLADVTFKLSPTMFYQLYTVHIQGPGIAPVCLYRFLPNKTGSTYKRFVDILFSLLQNAALDNVLIDFELAAMQAFEKALPNATILGCFLHLSQSFIILVHTRIVFILAKYIVEKFESAFFPPSIWNKREAASEGFARTTNAVEGWHFGIQAFLSKPSFRARIQVWRTLENLKKDAATQNHLHLLSTAGTEFSRKKSTENWRRRWKARLNVIRLKIRLPSSERWRLCRCQFDHYE